MIKGEQIYLPDLHEGDDRLEVMGSEFHHLVNVRRFKAGDSIWVVNGRGLAALTTIQQLSEKQAKLDIQALHPDRGEQSSRVKLAIANLKGSHLDLVVEKATELGVAEIVPLLTDHTVKKGINRERLEKISIAAMKQSGRSRLPLIHDLTPVSRILRVNDSLNLFCHEGTALTELAGMQKLGQHAQITIWIGPEGDWSQDEIDLASVSDYTFTGLGPRRLRAETAAIHAVGLVSALLQDPA